MGAFFISIIRQHPKKHKRQSRPPMDRVTQRHWLHIGSGTDRRRKGELALNPRLPHNQRTYPSDCKAGAREKAVPLGGRWRRQATEGGNSLSILDCPTTNAPTPATAKQEPALKPRLPPNKDTEPSLPSMELRGGGPDRARRGVSPSHNHHSLST